MRECFRRAGAASTAPPLHRAGGCRHGTACTASLGARRGALCPAFDSEVDGAGHLAGMTGLPCDVRTHAGPVLHFGRHSRTGAGEADRGARCVVVAHEVMPRSLHAVVVTEEAEVPPLNRRAG